nr:MAG TPA: hypothetical protein [Caudoviricetes sp.]
MILLMLYFFIMCASVFLCFRCYYNTTLTLHCK